MGAESEGKDLILFKKELSLNPSINDLQNVLLGFYSITQDQKGQSTSKGRESNVDKDDQALIKEQKSKGFLQQQLTFNDYNAATIVLQSLEHYYTDLIEYNGVQLKIFMNDMIQSSQSDLPALRKEGQLTIESKQSSSIEEVKRNQVDEIEQLMTNLKGSKNRKERRRLLAQYNQKQEQIWGQLQSYKRKKSNTTSQENDKLEKVFNEATNSYVDKDIYEQSIKEDNTNPNYAKNQKKLTQVLSRNQKLHSINQYEKTQNFEQKVNIEKEIEREKIREELNQRRKFIENNMNALESIQEGQRVAAYFENEEQVKDFVVNLKEQKDAEKKALHLEDIDKSSKLQREDHGVIPSREEIGKVVMRKQIEQLQKENNLNFLDESQKQQLLTNDEDFKTNDVKLLESKDKSITKNQMEVQENFLERQQNPKYHNLNEVQNKVGEERDSNFIISKAKPLSNLPEKAMANQKKKILNMTANDRYIAENYYNQGSMEELLYEKDGTISKMKQFDYKVNKYFKKDNKGGQRKFKKQTKH